MERFTPRRLIIAAVVLAVLGSVFVWLTYVTHGSALRVCFVIGNALLVLAVLTGVVGLVLAFRQRRERALALEIQKRREAWENQPKADPPARSSAREDDEVPLPPIVSSGRSVRTTPQVRPVGATSTPRPRAANPQAVDTSSALSRDERMKVQSLLDLLIRIRILLVIFFVFCGLVSCIYLIAHHQVLLGLGSLAVAGGNATILHVIMSWAEQMLLLTWKIARSGRLLDG